MKQAMIERRLNYYGHERPKLATRVPVQLRVAVGVSQDGSVKREWRPSGEGIFPVHPNRFIRLQKDTRKG